MALRIAAADLPSPDALAGGLDRLVVLGVDSDLTPDAGRGARCARCWARTCYTDGLSALRPGTPTNVSRGSSAGAAPDPAALDCGARPREASDRLGLQRQRRRPALARTRLRRHGQRPAERRFPAPPAVDAVTAGHTGQRAVGEHARRVADRLPRTAGRRCRDRCRCATTCASTSCRAGRCRRCASAGSRTACCRWWRRTRFAAPAARFEDELMRVLRQLRALLGDAAARVRRAWARAPNLDADLTRAACRRTPRRRATASAPVLGPLGRERHAGPASATRRRRRR